MILPPVSFCPRSRELVDAVEAQLPAIERASEWFAESILAGRVVHVFGSGHSRIMVEEMWPRYGSYPGFNPIVELSLSLPQSRRGRQRTATGAMYLENVPGLAERILRNFAIHPPDTAFVISSGGCNVVPIEMAQGFRRRGVRVVALVSRRHAEASQSRHPDGVKLHDVADLVIDTGAPVGDAMVHISGLETPVSPGSTVGGCLVVNAIKASVAALAYTGRSSRRSCSERPPSWGRSAPPNGSSRPTMSTRVGWQSFTGNSSRTSNFQLPIPIRAQSLKPERLKPNED